MSDERLRTLEQRYRATEDPADLARWLVEARRCGAQVLETPGLERGPLELGPIELGPLELALACGSEVAAAVLGVPRAPDHVVCFRSLCRELRLRTGRVGKNARAELAAWVLSEVETASSAAARVREELCRELLDSTRDPAHAHTRRSRCQGLVDTLLLAGSCSARFAARARRAIDVLAPNNRASSGALEGLLNLACAEASSPEAARAERQRRLARAKGRLEAWAMVQLAVELARPPRPEPVHQVSDGRPPGWEIARCVPDPPPRNPEPRAERTRRPKPKTQRARSLRRQPRKRRGGRRR